MRRMLAPGRSRVGLLHGVRIAVALTVLGLTTTQLDAIAIGVDDVAVPTAGYLLLAMAAELLRVRSHRWANAAAKILLVVDIVYLSAVVSLAGGAASLLGFLIPVHLVSVSLLLSHQTGLRLAVGYSFLLIGGHYLPALQAGEPTSWASGGEASLAVVGFWAVAIVVAIFAGMNERELLRGRAQLEGLTGMAAELKGAREPEEVAQVLTEHISKAFGGVRAAAVVAQDPQHWLRCASDGSDEPARTVAVESGTRPFHPRGEVELVTRLDPARDPALAAALPAATNVVILPMVVEGNALGAVAVECGGPVGGRVATGAVTMLAHYASQAALALRNAHLLADITRMALSDPLTGLANRRSFEESYAREVDRSRRSAAPLSVVMVDIDHFKRVNDDHGHEMGDLVLVHVGERLPKAARPMDICARLGGEEFVVLLPGCTPVEALHVAERLRAAIAADAPLPITASAGVATLGVHLDDPAQLLPAADEALYAAKAAGRDQVALTARVTDTARPVGSAR
jgi:two-component system, cell cycle response regulator